MTAECWRRHRNGLIAAAVACLVTIGAVLATGSALIRPIEPARHTLVVAPPSLTYGKGDVEADRGTTCAVWDQAARTLASTSKLRAAIAEDNGSSPEARNARTDEKRVGVSVLVYLRTKMGPSAPAAVSTPIRNWIVAQIDRLHAVNMRDWNASNVATARANELASKIVIECGLR
ncbi:hypothetical protein TUM20985_29160 [Mycobacterium antarcticum]|uniref:hypothetical protein n=1 Tax=unclassified Mycolicibacterium TaxID=2636767 RepID=UPI0023998D39|nr:MULTISPECIES: hypothetical protein [unclassified Mycolicibacterium]BDX32369.1 hypothetical protein TUM20985_29160 [Mycolicibacterium sp. TUM20985]GLP84088.1 hypothetical protein TUM20984_55080 [Mycolicibacterium sp. TUM20984]